MQFHSRWDNSQQEHISRLINWLGMGGDAATVLPGWKAPTRAVFNMSQVRDWSLCGTACCIAGFIAPGTHEAQELLGLTKEEATDLFCARHDGDFVGDLRWRDHWNITPAMALRVVRHLAETGEVDWRVALEDGE